jgi:hypothetical protein
MSTIVGVSVWLVLAIAALIYCVRPRRVTRECALAAANRIAWSQPWRPHAGSVCDPETGARVETERTQRAHDKWADVTEPLSVPVNVPKTSPRDRDKVVSILVARQERKRTG